MKNLLNAVHLSIRFWMKTPLIFGVSILMLAAGIGASAAAYAFLRTALLRDLPVDEPQQIMRIGSTFGSQDLPAGHYYDLIAYSPVLADAVLTRAHNDINFSTGDSAQLVTAAEVSGNYFEALDVAAIRGRVLAPGDDRPGADPVVVVSERFWRNHLGGAEDRVGALIRLNGRPATLIGVISDPFRGTDRMTEVDVWFPHQQTFVPWQRRHRSLPWNTVLLRLREGRSAVEVQGVIDGFIGSIREEIDAWSHPYGLTLRPERSVVLELERETTVQTGFVLAVLLALLAIACANVSNIALARLQERRTELAMRLALGARRRSIFGILATDGFLIACLGGAAGIGLSLLFMRGFSYVGMELTAGDVLDRKVLIWVLGLVLGVGTLCTVFPVIQAMRTPVNAVLKESTRSSTRFRAGKVLVFAQVALSLALLIACGLFIRSMHMARQVETGIRPGNIVSFSLDLDHIGSFTQEERIAFQRRLVDRFLEEPDIESVGIAQYRLLQGTSFGRVAIDGADFPDELLGAGHFRLGPGFLETLGVELVRGRIPTLDEAWVIPERRGYAVINQTMADRFWPGEDPVGRTFRPWGGPDSAWIYEVVGVCRDFRTSLRYPVSPLFMYADAEPDFSVILRTRTDAAAMKPRIEEAMRDLEPGLPVQGIRTLDASVRASLESVYAGFRVTLVIGILALAIAMFGIYAALSHWIRRLTGEIGLRMALGASVGGIVWRYVLRGAAIVLVGLAVGIVVAIVAMPRIGELLYGVSPRDPVTFVAVPLILLLTALVSCYLSARHAGRVDPMVALRTE